METFYVISRNHFEVKWGIVGTLVILVKKIGKKNTMKELVCGCDLKMSHIGGSPQLVSVYIWAK